MNGKPSSLKRTALTLGLVACLSVAALVSLTGCGRKALPRPQLSEDIFALDEYKARRIGNCLVLEAQLSGNTENLERVELQIEPVGPWGSSYDCPTCPFAPRIIRSVRPGSQTEDMSMVQDNSRLVGQYCGLAPGVSYRYRLVLYNAFGSLPPTFSPVNRLP